MTSDLLRPAETVRAGRPSAPRLARSGNGRGGRRKSFWLTLAMALFSAYALLPLFWLVVSASKTQPDLFSTFGLWFSDHFALFENIKNTFAYDGGIFSRWLANTLLYVVTGAGGATFLAALAGYGLAKFDFPGKRLVFASVLGAIAIPGTALAVPTFLLFSKLGLTNTPWSIILPSMISPFGLYLVWVYARDAVPTELLEAARLDGAGEVRTFFTVSLRLLGPALATVSLFTIVATWNNYFLPLIMLSVSDWYPLTVGLNQWNEQANATGGRPIYDLVLTGSLLTIVPIIAVFLVLQKYWQSGLGAGSIK
jgi:multiple sugar transport system permease protein